MRKKLIGLAVAGALAAPFAAQAQGSNVQIYGLIQPSIDFVDNGDDDGHFIQDNNSRLGFKGSEDLGGGLKAIFQLESRIRFDERGDGAGWVNRDSWVGLAGGFGSLTVGNHQSAYVRSTAALDPFADTIGDYNNIMSVFGVGVFDFNDRFRNSIYYTSPKFGGFQILASYALRGEGFDDDDVDFDPDDDNTWSLAASWSSGPFSLIAAYERQEGYTNDLFFGLGEADPWAVKIGGSFKLLPTTTLYAMVDRLDTDTDADERWAYYLGAKHSMGNVDLLANAMYARGTDGGLVIADTDPVTGAPIAGATLGDDDGAWAFSIGAVYNFSKRTNIGAYYTRIDNDDDGVYGIDSGGYEPDDFGDNVQAISVRVRHAF